MFKSKHGTADERLAELVSEVTGTIRSLDENLLWCLIEPLSNGYDILPIACDTGDAGCSRFYILLQTRISRHIDCRSCNRPRTDTTTHTVADFTARTCSCPVERLYCSWEVVRFSLQGDNTLDVGHAEPVAGTLVCGCKLLDNRSLGKSHIIFIGRQYFPWMFCRSFLNHGKERRLHLLAIDDERTTENLMTAMFRINLCKTENLGVGQRPTVLLLYLMQVSHLFWRQRKSFLLVKLFQVVNTSYRSRFYVHFEDVLIQSFVHALQHRIVLSILRRHGKILFNTRNTFDVHVLRNLNSIGTPRSHHLAARTYEISFNPFSVYERCFTI